MEFDWKKTPVHYHNITKDDMLNGNGLRVVLWLAGCIHQCKDCQNPITWDACGGLEFDEKAYDEIIKELEKGHIKGITFSGGDPLHPANRQFVGEFCKYIKENYPTKDIWLYTGYTLTNVVDEFKFAAENKESFEWEYLNLVDFVVDGRFETDLRQADIKAQRKVHWRGSSNQRVIDVQRTLENNAFVCID